MYSLNLSKTGQERYSQACDIPNTAAKYDRSHGEAIPIQLLPKPEIVRREEKPLPHCK